MTVINLHVNFVHSCWDFHGCHSLTDIKQKFNQTWLIHRWMLELTQGIFRYPCMYRQSVMMEQERMAQEQFITRLGSLPVVNSAWLQACTIYQKTKDRNALLHATCSLAEGGVRTITTTTKPLLEKYQPQLEHVNSFACEKLAQMEETYPMITRPTDEVLKETKDKCETVLKPVTDRVNSVRDAYNGVMTKVESTKGMVTSVKDYSVSTVTKSLQTPMGRYAVEKMNEALTVSEDYVEKYLPPTEEEMATEIEDDEMEVDEVDLSTMSRVTTLGTKLQKRLYRRAMKHLAGLQLKTREGADKLNFTVDLIQYAKSGMSDARDMAEEKYEIARTKLVDTWGQITDEDAKDLEDTSPTFEGRMIVTARRLTRQVRHAMDQVSGYLPAQLQPAEVRQRLEVARKYSEDMYMSFKSANKIEDLPTWVLQQTKEKMSYIQDTATFLTDTFLIAPVSWMVSTRSLEKPGEASEVEPIAPAHTTTKMLE